VFHFFKQLRDIGSQRFKREQFGCRMPASQAGLPGFSTSAPLSVCPQPHSYQIAVILEGKFRDPEFGPPAKARKLLFESLVLFDDERATRPVGELRFGRQPISNCDDGLLRIAVVPLNVTTAEI